MRLIDYSPNLFILAHREPIDRLEANLAAEGFDCQVLRQVHRPDQANFARSYLCLLNHRRAWEWVAEHQQPAIIVEADFVPVCHFGSLPLPFDPEHPDVGLAWLYTCAAQVYDILARGYAQGYSTSMVAYVLHPRCVGHLLAFCDRITADPGPTRYYAWDSDLDKILLAENLRNYIPLRNYGEHGSNSPNPEHRALGLSPTHRADVLYGPLAFVPDYAASAGFWRTRFQGRIKGLGRLFLGRFVRPQVLRKAEVPLKILRFALGRQLCWRL